PHYFLCFPDSEGHAVSPPRCSFACARCPASDRCGAPHDRRSRRVFHLEPMRASAPSDKASPCPSSQRLRGRVGSHAETPRRWATKSCVAESSAKCVLRRGGRIRTCIFPPYSPGGTPEFRRKRGALSIELRRDQFEGRSLYPAGGPS